MRRCLEALTAQLEVLSQSKPVLMIFEDVHWVDPTSLEALGRTVDRLRTLGVLLIITFRPEFEPPWIGRPHVTVLSLNRLGEREIIAMIGRVTGNKPLATTIRQDIIERTDGIPLFVEEMTKAVLEAESEGDVRKTAAAIPSSAVAVPASLHASLMARLDRLGHAKEVAQIGAVIGREFSHALLAAVVRKSVTDLNLALDRLIEAGLLFRQGVPPHASYLFKHALVQDVAYGTLLRDARRGLHARLAETLESKFADIAENQPELLARHYTEAGQIEKAAGLWGKAGQRSLERSAMIEAVAQFTRALDQIAVLPATPALRQQQIKLQVGFAFALYYTKGYAAAETKAAFDRARAMIEQAEALGEHLEDPLLLYSVLYGLWVAKFVAFDGNAAIAIARQSLALAEQQKTTAAVMIGHRLLGPTLLHLGEPAEGLKHLDRAFALYEPGLHRPLATRFGQDLGATILMFRSLALWSLGYPGAALAELDRALKAARETAHAPTLMLTLCWTALTHIWCRNYAAANAQLDECAALAEEKSIVFWKMFATVFQGCVLALTGKASDAVQAIGAGLTVWRPLWLSDLALTYADLGKFDDAWRCIGEAMTTIETTKEKWLEAEVNRIAGEIALMPPEPDTTKAQVYFERALAVARAQQAKSWDLRATMSMARLWRDQGKPQQARELLAPVYGWFTEGFDTLDLKEAKTLLDELA
jgi:predicted ATPase